MGFIARQQSMSKRKNPLTALFLSLILPGLGQIYNRERSKGLLILASFAALGTITYGSSLYRTSAGLAFILVWITAIIDAHKTAKVSGQPVDFYYRVPYVVAALLLVGPLALPLLWRSPYFSRFARWSWTIVVLGAVLLFVAMPYWINWLIQQAPDLATILRQSGIYP